MLTSRARLPFSHFIRYRNNRKAPPERGLLSVLLPGLALEENLKVTGLDCIKGVGEVGDI
jgi:hypothetical protein